MVLVAKEAVAEVMAAVATAGDVAMVEGLDVAVVEDEVLVGGKVSEEVDVVVDLTLEEGMRAEAGPAGAFDHIIANRLR